MEAVEKIDSITAEDLEGLVDIFRTLLLWEKELECDKDDSNHGCDNNKQSE